jgi:hypothetical protein
VPLAEDVHELPTMSKQKHGPWQRFGDLVYGGRRSVSFL